MKLDGSRDSGNCDENRYTPVRLISLLVVILSVSIFSYLDGMKNMSGKYIYYSFSNFADDLMISGGLLLFSH